jgi:hypothetical protein
MRTGGEKRGEPTPFSGGVEVEDESFALWNGQQTQRNYFLNGI